jgi:hypothetical protein
MKTEADVENQHAVSLEEAQQIFDQVYIVDQKRTTPNNT